MPLLGVLYWSAFSGLWGIETQSQPASAKEEGVWPHKPEPRKGRDAAEPRRKRNKALEAVRELPSHPHLAYCSGGVTQVHCSLTRGNLPVGSSESHFSRFLFQRARRGSCTWKVPKKDWPSSIQLPNLRVITGRRIGHDSQPSSAQESTDGQTGVCVCLCVCVTNRERGQ